MKTYKTIALLFLLTLSITLLNCGGDGGNKDKMINYYNNSIEFFKTDDFRNNIGDGAYLESRRNEIVIESGFENDAEFQKVVKELENDEELKKLDTEMMQLYDDILKEEMERIHEGMDMEKELNKEKEDTEMKIENPHKTQETKEQEEEDVKKDEKQSITFPKVYADKKKSVQFYLNGFLD